MDITKQIDTRLSYRIGYPTLPVLPVKLERVSVSNVELYEDITRISSAKGVQVGHIRLYHRHHEGQDRGKATLLLATDYEPNCEKIWVETVKAVHQHLEQAGLDYNIEIIDGTLLWLQRPRAIANQALCPAIDQLQPRIMDEITRNQHAWVAVDVLDWYSVIDKKHHPTFVITARDADSQAWWDTTLPSIRQILADSGHDIRVDLRYLNALTLTMDTGSEGDKSETKRNPPDPSSMANFYSTPTHVGTSCGLAGSQTSGTWGGRILLTKDGSDMELGLTNSHVLLLRDYFESHPDSSKGPFPPKLLSQTGLQAVSPSDKDHARALKKLSESSTKEKSLYDHMLTMFGDMDLSQEQKDNLDDLRANVVAAHGKERTAKRFNRLVGPVFAASGMTTTKFNPANSSAKISPDSIWALDWALFSIDQPMFQSNVSDRKLMQWERIRPNKEYNVRVYGRSSGKAPGLISPVKSMVNISGTKPPASKDGLNIHQDIHMNQFQGPPVTAHCLISEEKGDRWVDFILPGDSGSLIIADYDDEKEPADRTVYGLAFASNEDTLVSYMIPAELLVENIASVTGGSNVRFIRWSNKIKGGY